MSDTPPKHESEEELDKLLTQHRLGYMTDGEVKKELLSLKDKWQLEAEYASMTSTGTARGMLKNTALVL